MAVVACCLCLTAVSVACTLWLSEAGLQQQANDYFHINDGRKPESQLGMKIGKHKSHKCDFYVI